MGFIEVTQNGHGFHDPETAERFVPVGTNYCGTVGAISEASNAPSLSHLFGTDEQTLSDGLDEARRWLERFADLGLNTLRIWLDADVLFPYGRALDAAGADRLDAFLDACDAVQIRVMVGMHLANTATGWRLHNFQPPHNERLLEMLHLMGQHWARREAIFSWSIVGEGQLPWYTRWIHDQWSAYLQYWYNDDLDALKQAWGTITGVNFNSFDDAPVPPRNIGACLGDLSAVNAGNIHHLPHDPHANTRWRYDWRMLLEEIGARRVRQEAAVLRGAGVRQMICVGANCWTVPGLPAGQMTVGYVPNFHLDAVDYLCQHNYPAQQCLPGGGGDPLDNDQAMADWLLTNQTQGRLYGSLNKPVMLEEFGWYGGGSSRFLNDLPERSEVDQARYGDAMMESSRTCYAGWLNWLHRDMPRARDITNRSGLFTADGKFKPWGRAFGQWAQRLKASPPTYSAGVAEHEVPMCCLFTDDVGHEKWWQQTLRLAREQGSLNFRYRFDRRPITEFVTDLTP